MGQPKAQNEQVNERLNLINKIVETLPNGPHNYRQARSKLTTEKYKKSLDKFHTNSLICMFSAGNIIIDT